MLDLVYEDYHCLAVSKPAPLATQAPAGVPSVESLVKAYIKDKYAKPGNVYLGVPHRLDRPVTGVLLFARNTKAARRLAEQFRERRVQKIYWALVQGCVEPSEGIWEDWLLKVADEARTELASPNTPGSRMASLAYRVLAYLPGEITYIELKPLTGRSHQLRVQTASRGHPILGDYQYGSTVAFGPNADLPRDRVIALHARELTVDHPTLHHPLTLTASLPRIWVNQVDLLGTFADAH